jgi:radical SAM superfamily enzyme YgiQ (UPF0313 family)
MRIHFLEPSNASTDPHAQCWYTTDDRRFAVPLLAIPVLGALIPREHQVAYFDEKLRPFDEKAKDCDVACISFKSKDAKRAYRLADELRQSGSKVILGGVHASLDPREAMAHADAVVAGEAEEVFAEVIADAQRGQLKPLYHAPLGGRLDNTPIPRFELIEHDRYWVHAVQTSRGCLVGCEFCPIQKFSGGRARHKRIDRVLEEVDRLREIDRKKDIFFTDEMFCGGDRDYQAALLSRLERRKLDFYCISDFKVMDRDYVEQLARAGCKMLVINMPGTCFPHEVDAVRAIQRMGIKVWGFFMFGFSFHDANVFERVVDLVKRSDMKQVTITVICPFPNTPFAQRLAASGGLLSDDSDLLDQCHVVCSPERFSPSRLQEGFSWAWKKLEPRFAIHSRTGQTTAWERRLREAKNVSGIWRLRVKQRIERMAGRVREPVNLLESCGTERFEVAVTPQNALERRFVDA